MDFHVMTLFPDMIMDGLNTSITGRAIKAGVMSVKAYDIREYSNDKHLKVDDYPYGGGAGMVMRAAPVCEEHWKKTKSCLYDSSGLYIYTKHGRGVCQRG